MIFLRSHDFSEIAGNSNGKSSLVAGGAKQEGIFRGGGRSIIINKQIFFDETEIKEICRLILAAPKSSNCSNFELSGS